MQATINVTQKHIDRANACKTTTLDYVGDCVLAIAVADFFCVPRGGVHAYLGECKVRIGDEYNHYSYDDTAKKLVRDFDANFEVEPCTVVLTYSYTVGRGRIYK